MAASDRSCLLFLLPVDLSETEHRKMLTLVPGEKTVHIGRMTNAKTAPAVDNGIFLSKVLSRQHAETWADDEGRVFIRDIGSSNGTFLNKTRLCEENCRSKDFEIKSFDSIELGVNIIDDNNGKLVFKKVSLNACVVPSNADAALRSKAIELFNDNDSPLKIAEEIAVSCEKNQNSKVLDGSQSVDEQVKRLKATHLKLSNELKNFLSDAEEARKIVLAPRVLASMLEKLTAIERELNESTAVVVTLRRRVGEKDPNNKILRDITSDMLSSCEVATKVRGLLAPHSKRTTAQSAGSSSPGPVAASSRNSRVSQNQATLTRRNPQSDSGFSFLLFFTVSVLVLVFSIYYVTVTPKLRIPIVKWVNAKMDVDLTDFFNNLEANAYDLIEQAKEYYLRIKSAVFPTQE